MTDSDCLFVYGAVFFYYYEDQIFKTIFRVCLFQRYEIEITFLAGISNTSEALFYLILKAGTLIKGTQIQKEPSFI
jgi:hypothetical protein